MSRLPLNQEYALTFKPASSSKRTGSMSACPDASTNNCVCIVEPRSARARKSTRIVSKWGSIGYMDVCEESPAAARKGHSR